MALVSLDAIREAGRRIESIARRTPVIDVSDLAGRPLFLKCEPQQPGGAFKIRGATNMLMRLPADALKRGVITYSSGNHGQAVALAASRLGAPAVIVMPTTAPAVKVAGVKRWGAEVVLEGTTSIDRRKRAEAIAEARGLTMVPPFDHEWIIEGQGTCGLEILEQVPNVDIVVVPVGGGGLIAGVAAAIKQARRQGAPKRSGAMGSPRDEGAGRGAGGPDDQVKVVGVEPSGAAKMTASITAGQPVTLEKTASIADGLMPVRPGDRTFEHVREFVDQVVTVDDAQIARAALWLFHEAKQVVEPSGAATTAAVLWPTAGSLLADRSATVVAILSGGNVAPETLAALTTVEKSLRP